MANIASQKKRILRTERERLENRRYTSTIKTYFRRLEAAVESGDADTAAQLEQLPHVPHNHGELPPAERTLMLLVVGGR